MKRLKLLLCVYAYSVFLPLFGMNASELSTEEGITFVCSDDKHVTLNKRALRILSIFSKTIKHLVLGGFKEAQESRIKLPSVNSTVFGTLFRLVFSVAQLYKQVPIESLPALIVDEFESLVTMLVNKLEGTAIKGKCLNKKIVELYQRLAQKQFQELALPLLIAADFFDVPLLVEALCRYIAKNLTDKDFLKIPNGFAISEELSRKIASLFYLYNSSLQIISHNTFQLRNPTHTLSLDCYKDKKYDEVRLEEGMLADTTFLAAVETVQQSENVRRAENVWRYITCDLKGKKQAVLFQQLHAKRAFVRHSDLCFESSQALVILQPATYNYATEDGRLVVWNTSTGKQLLVIENNSYHCAYFLSNIALLAVNPHNACVITVPTGEAVRVFNFTLSEKEQANTIRCYYDFNRRHNILAVMFPEHIEVWDVKQEKQLCFLEHKIPYYIYENHLGIVLSPCGTKLLFGTSNSDLRDTHGSCCVALWDILTSKQIAYFEQCFASCTADSPYFLLSHTVSDDYKVDSLYAFNGNKIKCITKPNGECITSKYPPLLTADGTYFLLLEPHFMGKWMKHKDSEELDATLYTIDGHPTIGILDPTPHSFESTVRRIKVYSNQHSILYVLSDKNKVHFHYIPRGFKPASWQQMTVLIYLHCISLEGNFLDLSSLTKEEYVQKSQQETLNTSCLYSLLKLFMSFNKPLLRELIERYTVKLPQWVLKELE